MVPMTIMIIIGWMVGVVLSQRNPGVIGCFLSRVARSSKHCKGERHRGWKKAGWALFSNLKRNYPNLYVSRKNNVIRFPIAIGNTAKCACYFSRSLVMHCR